MGEESACQCRRRKRCVFSPWVRKIPWKRPWQPIPVFLPGESYGQRSLAGYSPWGRKESETTERLNDNNTRGWCCFPGGVRISDYAQTVVQRQEVHLELGDTRSCLVAQSWGNAGRWFQTRDRLALFPNEGATQGRRRCEQRRQSGFPWTLRRWLRICLQCGRPGFDPWIWKIPWRREWAGTVCQSAGDSLLPSKAFEKIISKHLTLSKTWQESLMPIWELVDL